MEPRDQLTSPCQLQVLLRQSYAMPLITTRLVWPWQPRGCVVFVVLNAFSFRLLNRESILHNIMLF